MADMVSIQQFERKLVQAEQDYKVAKLFYSLKRTELKKTKRQLRHAKTAQELLQAVAQKAQVEAHSQIAGVVTRCLKAVFGEGAYEFQLKFEKKRGKTEAVAVFVRDGNEVDPIGAAGGGVVDVAAFALRLAALLLSQPQRRRCIVADEPFKHLSKEYRPAVQQLLVQLAEELKIQIIMATHNPQLICGTVLEIE